MKLALVVPGGVDRSGEYRVIPALLALLKRLASRHEVYVFALRQETKPGSWMLLGAHIRNVGHSGSLRTQARAVAEIIREHRKARFDAVHSIWSGGCGAVAVLAAKLLGIPSIVHVAGGELAALADIGYGGRRTWRGRRRESLVLRGATAVSAASMPIITQLTALGCVPRRVPLGVDLNVWPARTPPRREPHALARLIHVASLNRVKDQPTLLRALAILKASGTGFHLDVAGQDTLDGDIHALAHQLGLDSRTTFHGFLRQPELRRLVEVADLNIVSSLHEAGPLTVLESAVAGVPSVGTAVGHIAEWAPEAALAVPPGDAAALADAIKRLIENEELRLRIAAEAMRRSIAEDADHTAALFEALYVELLATRPRSSGADGL